LKACQNPEILKNLTLFFGFAICHLEVLRTGMRNMLFPARHCEDLCVDSGGGEEEEGGVNLGGLYVAF
jgi:hypothetical protein